MNERRLQFQVGLVVLIAMSIGTALVIRFGDLRKDFERRYPIQVHLNNAGGLYPGAPALMSGLSIGSVRSLGFDPQGGVLAQLDIREGVRLPVDSAVIVSRALLGDTAIEFLPGRAEQAAVAHTRFVGQPAGDPLAAVQRLEGRAVAVLDSLNATSREWTTVAKNVNGLMETNRGNLNAVVERAAESLHQFTVTMQSANVMLAEANKVLADPRAQAALRETLVGLPVLVDETRRTIVATRSAVENIDRNLVNLAQVTDPIGQRGEAMVAKLDSSLGNLDRLLLQLNVFTQIVTKPNGSLQKFAADPSLYDNMDRSAESLAALLRNLEPVMRDVREFSDKIARNPELLGVGGAMRPSSGLRDAEILQSSGQAPGRQPTTNPVPRPIPRNGN